MGKNDSMALRPLHYYYFFAATVQQLHSISATQNHFCNCIRPDDVMSALLEYVYSLPCNKRGEVKEIIYGKSGIIEGLVGFMGRVKAVIRGKRRFFYVFLEMHAVPTRALRVIGKSRFLPDEYAVPRHGDVEWFTK